MRRKQPFTAPTRCNLGFWIALTTCVLSIKIAILALDSLPLFFLSDSAVYLTSAISSSMPGDRSFTYGLVFIRPILAVFGTLKAVVVIQSLLAGASSVVAALCLRIGIRAPLGVAALAAIGYRGQAIFICLCVFIIMFVNTSLGGPHVLGIFMR